MSGGGPAQGVGFVDHGDAILEWPGALAPDLCGALIGAFEAESAVRPGIVVRPGGDEAVDPGLKRSTDYMIRPDSPSHWLELDGRLVDALRRGARAYCDRYPWLPRLPTTFCGFQVQRTDPGEFFDWHADEDGRRRLAMLGYLNEDFEGGATEFRHQGVVYRPRRGSMLLFPPFWTHVHRGAPVTRGRKYVVTSFLLRAP